jgi:hypothetical protein
VALVGVLALAMALMLAAGRLGLDAVRRAQLDASADAVVLAAVSGGRPAAESTAAANGVQVERIDVLPAWARVTVRRGGQRATSTAVLVERAEQPTVGRGGDRPSPPP